MLKVDERLVAVSLHCRSLTGVKRKSTPLIHKNLFSENDKESLVSILPMKRQTEKEDDVVQLESLMTFQMNRKNCCYVEKATEYY